MVFGLLWQILYQCLHQVAVNGWGWRRLNERDLLWVQATRGLLQFYYWSIIRYLACVWCLGAGICLSRVKKFSAFTVFEGVSGSHTPAEITLNVTSILTVTSIVDVYVAHRHRKDTTSWLSLRQADFYLYAICSLALIAKPILIATLGVLVRMLVVDTGNRMAFHMVYGLPNDGRLIDRRTVIDQALAALGLDMTRR